LQNGSECQKLLKVAEWYQILITIICDNNICLGIQVLETIIWYSLALITGQI